MAQSTIEKRSGLAISHLSDVDELRSVTFRKGREAGWKKLDELITRVEIKGLNSLSYEEVEELPLLYRSVISSLSIARATVLDRHLLLYLENLSFRAYLVVYGPRTGLLTNFKKFLLFGFPNAVRSIGWHMLLAFLIMLMGCVFGILLIDQDINTFNTIVPEAMANGRGPTSTAQDLIQGELFAPWDGAKKALLEFASALFQNNTVIGILCFVLGLALGVPTVLLLFYNGMVVGAMIGLHAARGLTYDFMGWFLIHGVTELFAIILCGAAGLLVAQKIIFPGLYPRMRSLSKFGKKASSVAAGAIILFFVAAILEGFFRQTIAVTSLRYLFALGSAILWFIYFYFVGRRGGSNV